MFRIRLKELKNGCKTMIEITNAMVEAALDAFYSNEWNHIGNNVNYFRTEMRSALTAALDAAPSGLQDEDVIQELRTRLNDQLVIITQLSTEVIKLKEAVSSLTRAWEGKCPACCGTGKGDAGDCPCAECDGTGEHNYIINPVKKK